MIRAVPASIRVIFEYAVILETDVYEPSHFSLQSLPECEQPPALYSKASIRSRRNQAPGFGNAADDALVGFRVIKMGYILVSCIASPACLKYLVYGPSLPNPLA